ncbi:SgcJ/EcaC family oxidoreductase [Roseinatronobacter alkalisoli]|uniref:SgcJ/EcaC family oxidoreductase n=1 Tax=Roseinatronobacter alkalisoli TaxID=3028235 RepID=A0ABT5T9C4_9RHOB|nr:SgcJ/EcaC family oxidoreductase [Roseinatronobacter sp. HJB301]MDD7971586.1 SgcJ/EcaC family oxidoreductase [Roseinatronobacter sp. HJB301]
MTVAKQHEAQEITGLLQRWNEALRTGDPATVAALYASDAILLPTVSNEVRKTPAAIRNYFEVFLKRRPRARAIDQNIRLFDGLAINSGVYVISMLDNSIPTSVTCRYTFIYRWEDTGWKIIEHHSSAMPE